MSDWIISPDEKDLIAALGTNKIFHGFNHVDLRKKYGLQILDELVPVETTISEYGYLEIVRTDEWGEDGTRYVDPDPWIKRVFIRRSLSDWLVLLSFPHLFFAIFVSDRLSSRSNNWVLGILFVGWMVGMFFPPWEFKASGWNEFGLVFGLIYLFFPIMLPFVGSSLQSRKL